MMNVSRRSLLGTSAAGLALFSVGSTFGTTVPQPPLKAVVTIGGQSYEYREDAGTNLGDFVSEIGGFTQGCVRCEVAGSPLTVFFRPDRTSDRVEVVVELGRIFNATPVALGAYTVTLSRGTQVLTTVDVPAHYWFSRWRWQSAPRPIVGDVAALIAQNLLPPYDRAGALATVATTSVGGVVPVAGCTAPTPETTATTAPSTAVAPYTIMGLAGLNAYMPQTGERPEIGIVTEAQAEYICTARQTAADQMRAQAEAGGTVPWHMRDETTSAPLDLKRYPGATWYNSTTTGSPYVKTLKSPVTVDSAHQPALAYVPYLLTGDPYHLEDLQFQATWNLGAFVPQYRISIPQSRTFAWNLRTLAQCAKVTPASVPSWLLPKQYWTTWLADHQRFFEAQFVNSLSPERARFRSTRNIVNSAGEGVNVPQGTWIAPWEDDFVSTILGWVVAMGFTEWRGAFDWSVGSAIARTNRNSGWIRAQATPYRLIVRATATSPFADDWAGAWVLAQTVNKLTYVDRDTWVPNDMTYLTYTRGALVFANKLNAWDVTESLSWATGQLNVRKWKTAYKWRLGPGLV